LDDFDARIAAYDLLPGGTSDDDRFQALHAAEFVVSTTLDPLPATPAALRTALDAKRVAFDNRRHQFELLLDTAGSSFSTTLAAAQALLPLSDFDLEPFDLQPFADRAVTLA